MVLNLQLLKVIYSLYQRDLLQMTLSSFGGSLLPFKVYFLTRWM